MKIIKIAGLTALAYLSKVLASLFIIKQISVVHGPQGFGLLGNFMILVSLASTLAGGGALSGIIKYTAQFQGNSVRQANFVGSALIYNLFFSLGTLCIGCIFIEPITKYIFMDNEYRNYIYFFLLAQLLVSFNNFSFGVVNGIGKTAAYTSFLLIGNLMALIIAYYSIQFYGLWGAIIAVMSPVVLPSVPIFFYILKKRFVNVLCFESVVPDFRLLSHFTLMRVFSALCFPLVEIMVTNQIKTSFGLESAGYWQAVTKLSTAYLSFYSMFLTFYFLPLLAPLYEKKQIAREVHKMWLYVGSSFIVIVIFYLMFKNLIICTVLTDKFLPMSDLMGLQMLGDFFRVLGWVLGFVAVSKAATKLYILGEFFQGLVFVGLTQIMVASYHDVHAIVVSYVVTCFLYCLLSGLVWIRFLQKQPLKTNKMAKVQLTYQ